ncbi:hypothetical protein BRO54_3753 [Geobacillus proteiniphilus]|uniref:Uncharacterized protein n=1 Tax=Geobacillus proteiniphilus TaxID=860353 RepID=A0A1Q5SJ54_9BACL|nr:hypothetical protein BRO54_3753 [Geobacillus proteiniphilus]
MSTDQKIQKERCGAAPFSASDGEAMKTRNASALKLIFYQLLFL